MTALVFSSEETRLLMHVHDHCRQLSHHTGYPVLFQPWRVCDSTQQQVWEHPWHYQPETLYVLWTPEQTHGQGTHGRVWHSTPWHTLTLSMVYQFPEPKAFFTKQNECEDTVSQWWQTTPLTAWMMQQLHRAFKTLWYQDDVIPCPIHYKPINDLRDTQGRKLAGGLTEYKRLYHPETQEAHQYYVMGLGCNVWHLNTSLSDTRNQPVALSHLWEASPFPYGAIASPEGMLRFLCMVLNALVLHLPRKKAS
ncbi:MAG: hypothetical protein ACKO37_01970 [Vampirovibrionales bacterium]